MQALKPTARSVPSNPSAQILYRFNVSTKYWRGFHEIFILWGAFHRVKVRSETGDVYLARLPLGFTQS